MAVAYMTDMIKEMNCCQNKAFIFNNNDDFFLTGYRILQHYEKNSFVKCSKALYNGKYKLVYFSSGYQSLNDIALGLNAGNFINIAANIVSTVNDVSENGFLICQNIISDPDSIFIEPNTFNVKLIYMPLNEPYNGKSINEFKFELKLMLMKILQKNSVLSSDHSIKRLNDLLYRESLDFKELYRNIISLRNESGIEQNISPQVPNNVPKREPNDTVSFDSDEQPMMLLKRNSIHFDFKFTVSTPEFRIGRDRNMEGVIDFSQAVSREHCKIIFEHGKYYVTDTGSKHGTFVKHGSNDHYRNRLSMGERRELNDGDFLKLADIEFLVSF